MKTQAILGTAGAAVAIGIALLSACADTISAGTDPPPAPAPSFADPDAGPPPAPETMMCISYDCPEPYATCPGKKGLCNTNVDNDINNCGACGNKCNYGDAGAANALLSCRMGKCSVQCESLFGDCNGVIEDGCEAHLGRDEANCGACGNACKPGEVCWRAVCGCPPGYTQCASPFGGDDVCVRLDNDARNCGACNLHCGEAAEDAGPPAWPCGPGVTPHKWGPICEDSSCTFNCTEGFQNCNDDLCGDGCETDLESDPKNCGACGHQCLPEQGCIKGKCECGDPKLTFCNGKCTELQTDPANCGACGNFCPGYLDVANNSLGGPTCVLGRCGFACPPGRADCDHRTENGCEVDTRLDPLNCGGCGIQCELDGGPEGGQPCAAGQCLTKPCPPQDAGGVF